MKLLNVFAAAALLAGCQPASSGSVVPRNETQSGTRSPAKPKADASRAAFFARGAGGDRRELAVKKLTVAVTTQPGMVRSHLVMEVASNGDGQAEAVMRLPVPQGAAVTNAVLWVDDRPMRGAFVERQRANGIYTSIVTRRRDPALVSWDGPGWVMVSIFPLLAKQPRRFELEWVEPAAVTDGQVQYRVPIVAEGDRVIARAALEVDGRRVASGAKDLVAIAPASEQRVIARRAPGDPFQQVLVRDARPSGAPSFVLVVETSAAMTGPDCRRQRAVIDAVLGELPADSKLTLLAADWNASVIAEDAGASRWPDALARMDGVASAGALHLERALREAAARAGKTKGGAVLFVGHGDDGFTGDALAAPLADLRDGRIRLSAVAVGPRAVPRPLAAATVETGGVATSAAAVAESLAPLVDALRPRPENGAMDAGGGGEWHTLRTVLGEPVWIGRALDAPAASDAGTIRADATSRLAADSAALWDRARLEWLDHEAADGVASALTPATSLLVLETDEDYKRFGLAVPYPAVQSVFGDGPALGSDAQNVLGGLIGNQVGEAYGVGGLGVIGTGSGGGGTSERTLGLGTLGTSGKGGVAGYGARKARSPEVTLGEITARGSLDKEIIRRIIRRHINEVRYCYEQGLVKRPNLAGRAVVQFTIAASGQVLASVMQSSTLGNPQAESCIVNAVKRWEFPKPLGGGLVIVSYPFNLAPGDRVPEGASSPRMAPAPSAKVDDALATLAEGVTPQRIERISSLLGLRRISSAEVLAWTIDWRAGDLDLTLLVARLLEVAKRHDDAVRVLSEAARDNAPKIAAELRRIGAAADADEVLALARRAP